MKSSSSHPLVLIRHGQSEWNKKNLFTGWEDVDLSEKGVEEAIKSGLELAQRQIVFDCVFSSALKRAIRTAEIVLKQMELNNLSIVKAWQLNERHYGSLQGQNRQHIIDKYGADQVHKWRRDFNTVPPPLKHQTPLKQTNSLYKGLNFIPNGESLKDTQTRVLLCWKKKILPEIQNKKSVLIVAHGNSLRSLIKYLENIPDEKISSLEIKTGQPIVYQINDKGEIYSKDIL